MKKETSLDISFLAGYGSKLAIIWTDSDLLALVPVFTAADWILP